MSLAIKIKKYIETKKSFTLQELYTEFGDFYQNHSIRARIYDNKELKKRIIRTGRGSYILAGAEIEAIIEQVDSRKHIFHIRKMNILYDMVFFDIPYSTGGQRGGGINPKRNMANYDLIFPEEFGNILTQVEGIMRTEASQVYFMIAGGRSSMPQSQKYIRMFDKTAFKLNASGGYTKLNKDGTVCNMAQYEMPPELILSYSMDGKIRDCTEDGSFTMDFAERRPTLARYGGYPTEKPVNLTNQIVKQSTKPGEIILDLFAGGGALAESAISLGRKIHAFDSSIRSIRDHIIPRIQKFALNGSAESRFQPSLF